MPIPRQSQPHRVETPHLSNTERLAPIQIASPPLESSDATSTPDSKDDISRHKVGGFVRLALEHHLGPLGYSSIDVKIELGGRVDNTVSLADRTDMLGDLAPSAALVAAVLD